MYCSRSAFLKKLSNFSEWLYHFTFLPFQCKSSSFFTALQTLGVVRLFNFSCAYRYRVVSHCDSILHLPHDFLHLTSWYYEYLVVCLLLSYIMFGEVCSYFCPFFLTGLFSYYWVLKICCMFWLKILFQT